MVCLILLSSLAWCVSHVAAQIDEFSDAFYFREKTQEPFAARKSWNLTYRTQSKYQLIEVRSDITSDSIALYLDRALQLTTYGEHMYHENMAHIPLNTLVEPPRDVLVIGAGDGGVTLRVLRHPSVKRVVQVELDEGVVNVSRRFFPQLARAYDDPRVDLRIANAIAWAIERAKLGERDSFDAVIIDSTDDPVADIWTVEFYAALRQLLRPDGVLMQNVQNLDGLAFVRHVLQLQADGGFKIIRPVSMSTTDYGSPYIGFLSSGESHRCPGPAREDDALLQALASSWYTPDIHRGAMAIPPGLQRHIPEFQVDKQGCLRSLQNRTREAPPLPADGARDVVDVVVLGGGLAGLTAARVLASQLGQKVLLLEAKEQLGGRVETTNATQFGGLSVNLGASWIHYAKENPITSLAELLGCKLAENKNGNLRWYSTSLGELSEEAIQSARKFAAAVAHSMEKTPGEPGKSAAVHMAELVRAGLVKGNASDMDVSLDTNSPEIEAARHLHFFSDVVQDYTARLRDMSAATICANVCGGDPQSADVLISGSEGTRCLLAGLPSRLDEKVSVVKDFDNLEVRTQQKVSKIRSVRDGSATIGVDVFVSSGSATDRRSMYKVRARAAVVALPLGVLRDSIILTQPPACASQEGEAACSAAVPSSQSREGLVVFSPPLPEEVAQQWLRLGVGRSLRAALLFKEPFWDVHTDFFGHLLNETYEPYSKRESFYGDLPAVEFTNVLNSTGHPVLLVEVNKVLADSLALLPDEEVAKFLVDKALRHMFRGVVVPDPEAVAVKRFVEDPFVRIAQRFSSKSEDALDLEVADSATYRLEAAKDFWVPRWDGHLFFAGEHTMTLHEGTLDGAFLSGIQAAWSAACSISLISRSSLIDHATLLRRLAVFDVWFPPGSDEDSCLTKTSKKILSKFTPRDESSLQQSLEVCRTSWLEVVERCRKRHPAPESTLTAHRHCLDQGD
eukprot:TRINITY_DN21136_c0_g1_i1.p1 TRINITY_DN21136_c0_g1~~TRINITY_DN21136_c0_g1_i1.p1  ORF type:complete len:963 (+),score=144.93 TRINITY_DN21136_c0_g1_i1:54-2942(+)